MKKDDFDWMSKHWRRSISGYWKRLCVEWRVCLACLHFSKFSKIAFVRSSSPGGSWTQRYYRVGIYSGFPYWKLKHKECMKLWYSIQDSGNLNFPALFSSALPWQIFKLKLPKCQKMRKIQIPKNAGNSNSQKCGKFKFPKCKKVRGNSKV